MDNYHLSPPADGWELGKAGVERASKRAATKQELVGSLADFFVGRTAAVKIHEADGTMDVENTYPRSADPRHSRGWRLSLQPSLVSMSAGRAATDFTDGW